MLFSSTVMLCQGILSNKNILNKTSEPFEGAIVFIKTDACFEGITFYCSQHIFEALKTNMVMMDGAIQLQMSSFPNYMEWKPLFCVHCQVR